MRVSRLSLNAALLSFTQKKRKRKSFQPITNSFVLLVRTFKSLQQNQQRMGFFFPVLQIGVAREIWRAWDGMPAIAGCDGCILFYCYPLSPVNYSCGVFVQYSPAVLNSMLINAETSVEKYKHLE